MSKYHEPSYCILSVLTEDRLMHGNVWATRAIDEKLLSYAIVPKFNWDWDLVAYLENY